MITGALLVLVTWAFVACVLVALGGIPALVLTPSVAWPDLLRRALWWGLAIVTTVGLALNLWWPLRDGPVAAVILVLALAGVVTTLVMSRRRRRVPAATRALSVSDAVLVGALLLGVGYLALAAMGPVTNYDSGLYHLGAIRYSGEYATIPGLANLFFPLGYSTGQYPLAALMGNGPWDGQGFRLLNGLLVAMLAMDLAARFVRRRPTVGGYVLLAGGLAAWVPMISLSDYWVTSPSSDSAVLLLTVIATAYLADAAWGGRHWQADASVSALAGFLLLALRPTMGFFLATLLLVLAVQAVRNRGRRPRDTRLGWLFLVLLGVLLTVVQVARDYLLSGWLQYPLSALAFDVPWRAPDPVNERIATLGNARDPGNLWEAAHGWNWLPVWLTRLPTQWEFFEFGAILLAAIVMLVLAAKAGAKMRARALATVMLPSAFATLTWFLLTPPSFRFVWGPLFTLATIPLGWALYLLARSGKQATVESRGAGSLAVVSFAAVTVLLVAYCLVARLAWDSTTESRTWSIGPIAVGYSVAPTEQPPVVEQTIPSGLTVLTPTEGENCWAVFPLCTPRLPPTVRLRSDSLQGGLLP